jgi:hypothetical protein
MNLRRYILSLILPFWIRLGCPPHRLHLLSVNKRRSKGLQQIPISVVTSKGQKYIVGLEVSREWVRNVRKSKSVILRRGSAQCPYGISEVHDKATLVIVMKLYLKQEPYSQKFFEFDTFSSDDYVYRQCHKHAVFRLVSP